MLVFSGTATEGFGGELEVTPVNYAPEWAGCLWSCSRQAFMRMGGLEEALRSYGGDEFVTRIRLNRLGFTGLKITGWDYKHQMHTSYGKDILQTLHHVQELSINLGYAGVPEFPTTKEAYYVYERILEMEGL